MYNTSTIYIDFIIIYILYGREADYLKVYISNYLSRSISILDYSNFELEREIKLDENIYPHNFCIDKKNNLAYIPSSTRWR